MVPEEGLAERDQADALERAQIRTGRPRQQGLPVPDQEVPPQKAQREGLVGLGETVWLAHPSGPRPWRERVRVRGSCALAAHKLILCEGCLDQDISIQRHLTRRQHLCRSKLATTGGPTGKRGACRSRDCQCHYRVRLIPL